ncbi:MAG: metal ABC transporter ATP-binding protein [Candidatus Woesearchaeota archaeon]
MIELDNVSYSYDKHPVVKDVSLKIEDKDFLAIIGPNGGGKTTLIKLILGMLTPDEGKIRINGKDPRHGRKDLGYVPQHFDFDFQFPISVFDVVLMGRLGNFGRYSAKDKAAATRALNTVGMKSLGNRHISELSGGQRQRVFIARALAREPRTLLLDEPVSGLDSTWQNRFYELLKELNKDIAIVLVTHNIGVVSSYIEKLACINQTLHYHGSPKEGIKHLSETYQCPVELIAHGVPHRVVEGHD